MCERSPGCDAEQAFSCGFGNVLSVERRGGRAWPELPSEILEAFLGGVHGQNKYNWLEANLLEGANRPPQSHCSGATSVHTDMLSLKFTAPKA